MLFTHKQLDFMWSSQNCTAINKEKPVMAMLAKLDAPKVVRL